MKIAILGASGMLGSMLVDVLGEDFEVVGTFRNVHKIIAGNIEWRIFNCIEANRQSLNRAVKNCDIVINAIGAIPQRVKDKNTFYTVNSLLPSMLSELGIPVIQIATDCVFSGEEGQYTEKDKADDCSHYAQSKYLGEIMAPQFYNLRCSIIGLEPDGDYSLLKWLISQPQGAVVNGFTNHYWNGITTLQFAKICSGIIKSRIQLPNLQHIIPCDSVDKYSLLKIAARYFDRGDIQVKGYETLKRVDRRLDTNNPALNRELWHLAGYKDGPPTIDKMVWELAEYKKEQHGK
jgi:dTDP-4-dehydrorhamnose reductase